MKRLIIALTLFALTACGGKSDTDLEAAFCAGLEAGASRTVTATTDATGAPDVTDASRVDITLLASGDKFSGSVKYTTDEVGSFAFGLTEDVGLVVRDASGSEIPISNSVTGAACAALAVRYTVPLQLGTYTLELGPATTPTLGIIAEESDDDL